MSASGSGSGRGPTPRSRSNTSKGENTVICIDIPSRAGGSQLVPMSEEGEGVDHIQMVLTEAAMSRVTEKLDLRPGGEHMDHDGVKLRINAS